MVSALQLPKIKRYRVYLELKTVTGVWVESEGCTKDIAEERARAEAQTHLCEGEAMPYWHVIKSKTRRIKEDK